MEYLAIGFVALIVIKAYLRNTSVTPSHSDHDYNKYIQKLNDILTETRNSVKGAKSGYTVRIDDSRFGRTGYHDENEWKTYKSILYSEGIYVVRTDHTGVDSSIKVSVM